MAVPELAIKFVHYAVLTERMCVWVQISTIWSVIGEAGIDGLGKSEVGWEWRKRVC